MVDYRINNQVKDQRPWWVDVIFYIVVALFIGVLFSYAVLFLKNFQERQQISSLNTQLSTIGSAAQKQQEAEVFLYQKKIADVSTLLDKHTYASNTFYFIQKNTVADVWLKQFAMDQKSDQIQLSGQANSLESFSRQVANFENNTYVKSVGVISSSLASSNKVDFSFNLVMDPKIFSYIPEMLPGGAIVGTASSATNPAVVTPTPTGTPVPTPTPIAPPPAVTPGAKPVLSQAKSILSFHLLLSPEIIGTINEANHVISLTVPAGTNITSIKPLIVISEKAKLSPDTTLPIDFTNPVSYTVIAEDGTSQVYQAIVSVAGLPAGAPVQPLPPPVQTPPASPTPPQSTQPVTSAFQFTLPVIIFGGALALLIILVVAVIIMRLVKGSKKTNA